MQGKKIPTVSVGVSAYNEEKSIKKMLTSVIAQKEEAFKLIKIIVVSDGSTDKTVDVVNNFNDPRIFLVNDGQRLGQAARINQMLTMFASDYLILIDADMYLKSERAIKNMINTFKNPQVQLVGGAIHPLPGKTFIERAVNNYKYCREALEKKFSFEHTAFGAHAFLALSRKLAKETRIPNGVSSFDAYLFFKTISKGYIFEHSAGSVALYRSPQTLQDQVNQASRHFAGEPQLKNYFDGELVRKGFKVPLSVNINLMLFQLLKNPLGYIFLKGINIYAKHKSKKMKEVDARWQFVSTTKSL